MTSLFCSTSADRLAPLTSYEVEQVRERYADDLNCVNELFRAKWPDGFRCPRCSCPDFFVLRTRTLPLYQCRLCRHQTSVTAGTIMHRSRTPLRKWMIAIYLLSHDKSVNAVKLASIIKVTYKTSWLILHKIRHAISGFDKKILLDGDIKFGLTYYDRFKSLRLPRKHPLVIGATICKGNEINYIKMKFADNGHAEWHTLSLEGRQLFTACHTIEPPDCDPFSSVTFLPYVRLYKQRSLIACFKKALNWINFTFNGLATKHKQMYWDEFCFRANYSGSKQTIVDALIKLCAHSAHSARSAHSAHSARSSAQC